MEARGVSPRAGNVLVFPHGDTCESLVHEGSAVTRGVKYVIRTDVLYKTKTTGKRGPAKAAHGFNGMFRSTPSNQSSPEVPKTEHARGAPCSACATAAFLPASSLLSLTHAGLRLCAYDEPKTAPSSFLPLGRPPATLQWPHTLSARIVHTT
eukprot:32029-Chlamydomonas_euryale.AAC.2